MDGLDNYTKQRPKLVVVCGPTASGKSGLAIYLAKQYNGEIVGADSMQIYRDLVIGTAVVTPQEAEGVPHHLTALLSPEQTYSVADWVEAAHATIRKIYQRGKMPIVCGGTGLYIQSLIEGVVFQPQGPEDPIFQELEEMWQQQGGVAMLERLAALDPERAAKLAPKDKKRILRALGMCLLTGQTAAQREAASKPATPPYNTLLLGLNYTHRDALYNAVNLRVDRMMQQGLLQEAQQVYLHRDTYKTAAQAIGYKEFFAYFENQEPLQDAVARLKKATRNYSKRQLTWFNRMQGICWLNAEDEMLRQKAEEKVAAFWTE